MSKSTCLWIGTAAVAAVVAMAAPARAGNEADRCNDILRQDLFNRVSTSTQSSSSERAAFEEQLFKMIDTQAYQEYEKKLASSKAQATNVDTEFHYGVIGGELQFSHSYDRKLSSDEFSKMFDAAKERYELKMSSSSARDTSLISLYQSSVRDQASVKAWETCMTSNRAGPGLIAYGYRDASGSPYIVVIWAPGSFAASMPVVDVKFAVGDAGMTVEGAADKLQIATGSGTVFPLRFSTPSDRRAIVDEFAVLVNGELKSGGNLIQSFHAEAVVPRTRGETPCKLVFASNKVYRTGLYDADAKAMRWIGDFSTLEQLPSDHPDTEVYATDMGGPGGTILKVSGTGFTVVGHRKARRDSPDWLEVTQMTGRCSGEGMRARFVNRPELADVPDYIIQPR